MIQSVIKVAEERNIFKIIKLNEQIIKYYLHRSGLNMKHNIINEWLRSIFYKSKQTFTVLANIDKGDLNLKKLNTLVIKNRGQNTPTGLIEISKIKIENIKPLNKSEKYFYPQEATGLKLHALMKHSEATQLFLQWQRYRKIWWSSITTSPGLFHLSDISYKEHGAEVQVLAKFPWGQQPVETISIHQILSQNSDFKEPVGGARLESALTLECALLTLLTDGYCNRTSEEYLRLHRTMAPYKVSFAIEANDEERENLQELADHLNYRLNVNGISTWFPVDFRASIEEQLQEKYQLGVPYTVVLTAESLHTGVLHLLHSSTTLKEQIHISDFDEYALKLLKSCFSS